VQSLGYYQFFETKLGDSPVIVTRTGWTGELGYELYLLDPALGNDLWERVMDAGRKYAIAPTGPSDIRRIEAGILNYGVDMTIANNPYEVGLERLVDLGKPEPFIGREALQRVKSEGPKRRLAGVEIEGARLEFNMTRWPVRAGDAAVGEITSAIYSPRLKKNIGYAMVPVAHAALGTKLTVETPDGAREAVVVTMPFVDPTKSAAKS
jgi:aminomethyltransferase